ncbi:MAG: helix-turn-helix transcriptional regulator [Veillonellales bacterium]
METLGDKIKQLRNKLTQEELAAMLQVDRSTLASWEVNRREPDIATLCRLADFFKVSVDWLVGYEPDKEYTATHPNLFHETPVDYQKKDGVWQKVISVAQKYEFEPDTVCQILEMQGKIMLSLKKAGNNNIS